LYDAVDEPDGGEPVGYLAYQESRFATERARFVEAPFGVCLENGYTIRGRIDAIYGNDTHWEVVDFKSGKPKDDPSRMVQLEAYAIAVNDVEFGGPKPESVDVTFAYFGGGLQEVTAHADAAWVDRARAHVVQLTDAIEAKEFGEAPGEWCRNCDFLQFCGPGQAEVSK
jgi:RecB family exonuclease